MTDLVCDYEPWKGGMVHKGMKVRPYWTLWLELGLA